MRYLKRLIIAWVALCALTLSVNAQDLAPPVAGPNPEAAAERTDSLQDPVPAVGKAEAAADALTSETDDLGKPLRATDLAAQANAPFTRRDNKARKPKTSAHGRMLGMWAVGAYEQSLSALKSGKSDDPEPVYRWSRRMMRAEQLHFGNAAEAARNHLRRMSDLEVLVKAEAKRDDKETDEYNFLISAVQYYRLEAEKLFEEATVRAQQDWDVPDTALTSHDAAIGTAEKYVRAVLQGNTEAAAKLAVPGSIAASKRLMEGFKGFTSAESFTVRAIQGVGLEASVGDQTKVSIEEAQPAESGEARAQFTISLVLKNGHWLVTNFSAHKTAPRQNNTALGAPSRPAVGSTLMRQPQDADPFGAPPAAGAKETKVVVLGHAKANDIATTIATLNRDSDSPGFAIAVDDRTNRIIVRGPTERIAEIVELIKQLDVPGPERTTAEDTRPDLPPALRP
jgi:hypothetical protein